MEGRERNRPERRDSLVSDSSSKETETGDASLCLLGSLRRRGRGISETRRSREKRLEYLLTLSASIGVRVILKQAEAAEAPMVLMRTGRSTDSRRAMIPALACERDGTGQLSFQNRFRVRIGLE